MIRTPSSSRVNITVTSFQTEPGGGSAGGRPPRSAGGGGAAGAAAGGGAGAAAARAGRLDSLFVLLGLVLFLALMGLFFLHRLQASFEPGDEEEALHGFQKSVAGSGAWTP
jgi:hypothetical protein